MPADGGVEVGEEALKVDDRRATVDAVGIALGG